MACRRLALTLLSALLLLGARARADHKGELNHWLDNKPELKHRLDHSLGGASQRKAFVKEVDRAVTETRIGGDSARWLLTFTSRLNGSKAPESLNGEHVLQQLETAREAGAKTGMARQLRHYADQYLDNGVVRSRPDGDSKFVAQTRRLQQKVDEAKRGGQVKLPPLVIGLDGADGAGKSSSKLRLEWALRKLGYQVVGRVPHLLKPPAGQSYLDYFKGQVGALPHSGQVMFLDRTMLGQVAYGHDAASAHQAMDYLEQSLQPHHGKVLILTAQLPEKRAAQTYGKRLARELFTDDPSYSRVSPSDLPAFQRRGAVNQSFAGAASEFPGNAFLFDVGHRAAARRDMLRVVGRSILDSMKETGSN
jgi:hypothetical protein